jgi:catechol 2,3-dioxygenase-like lactoylglutathione lyase family enzyme
MPDEDFVVFNGQRMTRESAADLEEAQVRTHYCLGSKLYSRLPYGSETFRDPIEADSKPCRHCRTVKGQLHEPLCDYEQCPVCGGQVMSCDCDILVENAVRAGPEPTEAGCKVSGGLSFQLVAITIACTDLARSVRFYEEALGAVRRPDDGCGCPWFELGHFSISLLPNAASRNPAKFPDHSMAMLWVETDDLTAAAQHFAQFGVEVLNPSDGQSMIIADPDGIAIEVWQSQPEE